MDYMTELAAIANKNGGIIETKTAAQRGISKAMLYKLCKAEKIHRIVKGQYVLPEDMQDELLSISRRSGMPCICCIFAVRRQFFPMKRRCFFTGFPTGHPLSTP